MFIFVKTDEEKIEDLKNLLGSLLTDGFKIVSWAKSLEEYLDNYYRHYPNLRIDTHNNEITLCQDVRPQYLKEEYNRYVLFENIHHFVNSNWHKKNVNTF